MNCSCCDFRDAAGRQFDTAKASKKLEAYRKGQIEATTRALRDAIVDLELNTGSLLDVGGGFGALTFELLDRGVAHATIVDASAAYTAAAIDEASRRGLSKSTRIIHGDALQAEQALPNASLVTLDRVVCCYPEYEPLLEEAVRHAERAIALSYPRDRWVARAAMWLENAKRARTSAFRTFIHPPSRMQAVVERAGFTLRRRRTTLMWSMDIYARR